MDIINFDTLLSEKQLSFQKSIRSIFQREISPDVKLAHREGIFPESFKEILAKHHLLGAQLPESSGSLGLDLVSYGLLMSEMERVDSGLRTFASVQGALVMYPIWAYGSEAHKQKYLPKLKSGEWTGSFALTEPHFGSDPSSMKTSAKKVSGGYEITGSKSWITNGVSSDVVIVWAKLEDKICGFIVETHAEGFHSELIEGKFSMRMSETAHMIFKNCFVSDEQLLPGACGIKHALNCLNEARFGIIWGAIGAAKAVYEEAIEYAKARVSFQGKPLASHQLVQAKLVKMGQEIAKAQLLAFHITKLKESNKLQPHHVSLGKMNNCKMALECAREARDILGANGIQDDYHVMRHMMNLETVNTYEGTEDIHRLILGKAITGVNGFF